MVLLLKHSGQTIAENQFLRRFFSSSQIIQKYYYSEKLDVVMYNVPTEKLPCPS